MRSSLNLKTFGQPLVAIYLISDVGSIVGGWSSSTLMKRGYSANKARKLTMLVCAFLVMPIFLAQYAAGVWLAVAIVGLATAARRHFPPISTRSRATCSRAPQSAR